MILVLGRVISFNSEYSLGFAPMASPIIPDSKIDDDFVGPPVPDHGQQLSYLRSAGTTTRSPNASLFPTTGGTR
jgi:hypothetical protein